MRRKTVINDSEKYLLCNIILFSIDKDKPWEKLASKWDREKNADLESHEATYKVTPKYS